MNRIEGLRNLGNLTVKDWLRKLGNSLNSMEGLRNLVI